MLIDDPKKVEDCTKVFTNKYKFRGNQEIYKIDFDSLKSIIFNCALMTKQFNNIELKNNSFDSYIVYNETIEYLDNNNNVIGLEKASKKASKKARK